MARNNQATVGVRIFHESDLGSTSTVLKSRVEARQWRRLPVALTADGQTAGRGLGANTWCSDRGANALFSMAFRPVFIAAEHQFLLNMALSLSLLHTLDEWAVSLRIEAYVRDGVPEAERMARAMPSPFCLKWPNDLYAGERKLGGILFELLVMGDRCALAVMGVGVNVNQRRFPPELPNPVSLLGLLTGGTSAGAGDAAGPTDGWTLDMSAFRRRLIERAARDYRRLERMARHVPEAELMRRYKRAYLKRLLFCGLSRTYICQGERMEAVLAGVDDFGRAMVVSADGRRFNCGLKELRYVFEN